MRTLRHFLCLCAVLIGACPALSWAQALPARSTVFCMFELPSDDPNRQRWVNLAIVQLVDLQYDEIKIIYGDGNFGSGHEIRIRAVSFDAARALFERMRKTAAECR